MSQHRVLQGRGFINGTLKECRWCKGPVPKGRRTFCSGARTTRRHGELVETGSGCVHEYLLRASPQYLREHVFDRDRGVCAVGGRACAGRRWCADHIIPVIEGGGECGLENMRTLCTVHHNEATAALAKRRAEARKARRAASSSPATCPKKTKTS